MHNLPKLREIGFAANRRLLEAERLSHDCILAEDSFRKINAPVEQNGQRASGLRFADPRIQFLWQAVILFRLQANGFRAADLRQHLAALSGRNPSDISQGALTYQLRRLRLHGIIEKVANSFRYRITASGLRAALFFTRAYNRLLRPGLAVALPDHHAADGPLKRAFDKVETNLARMAPTAKTPPVKLDTFTGAFASKAKLAGCRALNLPRKRLPLIDPDCGRREVQPNPCIAPGFQAQRFDHAWRHRARLAVSKLNEHAAVIEDIEAVLHDKINKLF